jgi:hypothetical protein
LANTADLARKIGKNATFFTITLQNAQVIVSQISPDAIHAPLIEVSRGDHTLQFHDDTACLDKGNSGHPVFMNGIGPPYKLVGLLISGLGGCPSLQTVVRTDRLAEWIVQKIDAKLSFL